MWGVSLVNLSWQIVQKFKNSTVVLSNSTKLLFLVKTFIYGWDVSKWINDQWGLSEFVLWSLEFSKIISQIITVCQELSQSVRYCALRVLRARVTSCLPCLRTHMPCVTLYLLPHQTCVLTCPLTHVLYIRTFVCAQLPCVPTCLHAHIPIYIRADILQYPKYLHLMLRDSKWW